MAGIVEYASMPAAHELAILLTDRTTFMRAVQFDRIVGPSGCFTTMNFSGAPFAFTMVLPLGSSCANGIWTIPFSAAKLNPLNEAQPVSVAAGINAKAAQAWQGQRTRNWRRSMLVLVLVSPNVM